jgi:rubredoxin
MTKGETVERWQCLLCGYIYDPAVGDPTQRIAPGTAFEDLPDDWECPDCGASKDEFERMPD